MNWAISINITDEDLERRLEKIVSYVVRDSQIEEFLIWDIDATGYLGNQLTKKLNDQKRPLLINEKDLNILFSEEGQIFELDLLLKGSFEYRFIVRDGNFLDILGNGKSLPSTVVGSYKDLDVNLFN
ncbi:MAG TPA: hypothetical protein VGN00_22740 [Puia sp.]|jgi:hypothetical protein